MVYRLLLSILLISAVTFGQTVLQSYSFQSATLGLLDKSGNSRNLTNTGSMPFSQGMPDGSFSNDATGGRNLTTGDFAYPSGNMTYEMIIYQNPANNSYLSGVSTTNSTSGRLRIQRVTDISFAINTDVSGTPTLRAISLITPINLKIMVITITADYTTKTYKGYLNGELNMTSVNADGTNYPYVVNEAKRIGTGTYSMNAWVSLVKVTTGVFSPQQIKTNYAYYSGLF